MNLARLASLFVGGALALMIVGLTVNCGEGVLEGGPGSQRGQRGSFASAAMPTEDAGAPDQDAAQGREDAKVADAKIADAKVADAKDCLLCICEYDPGWSPGSGNCDTWLAAQTGCTKKLKRAVTPDPIPHDGCRVRHRYEGHYQGQCTRIDKATACIDSGCPSYVGCSQACSEFADPSAALAYLQSCAAKISNSGNWTLSISGNQVFGGPCESKVTLSCSSTPDAGVSDVTLTYGDCNTGYCYQHGKSVKCTLGDGGIGTMVCCVDHFVIDPPGGKCDTTCTSAKGKTCWGSPTSMTCKDTDGSSKTLKCCGKGCVGNGGYGSAGEWCEACT